MRWASRISASSVAASTARCSRRSAGVQHCERPGGRRSTTSSRSMSGESRRRRTWSSPSRRTAGCSGSVERDDSSSSGTGRSGPRCRNHPDLVFPGALIAQQLAAHYATADVFLFPSETETFGNVVLEAMASGLALVAYDYAAARMHVTHGETGVLIPYGQAAAFVAGAVELARSPLRLARIRRRAPASLASVAWPRVIERFEAILSDALGQRRSPS